MSQQHDVWIVCHRCKAIRHARNTTETVAFTHYEDDPDNAIVGRANGVLAYVCDDGCSSERPGEDEV